MLHGIGNTEKAVNNDVQVEVADDSHHASNRGFGRPEGLDRERVAVRDVRDTSGLRAAASSASNLLWILHSFSPLLSASDSRR